MSIPLKIGNNDQILKYASCSNQKKGSFNKLMVTYYRLVINKI
ncbi:MAG: hypothetical protein YK1309IOTA_2260007 [Marine Group I thaumarchaeote]|nr:MAG: hypothetical protein YK1309IOTA_2260007 [Marine Group I thaumarchaeote]